MSFQNLSGIQAVVNSIKTQLDAIVVLAGQPVSTQSDAATAITKRNQIEDEWATLATMLDDAKDKLDGD